MKKLLVFILISGLTFESFSQCGNFVWGEKVNNDPTGKILTLYERNRNENESIKLGDSYYLVRERIGGTPTMGTDFLMELFIDKINCQTLQTELTKSFVKTDVEALTKVIGNEIDKEYFKGSYVFSDKIVVLTNVRIKKQKLFFNVARIINPDLEVEKYIVYGNLNIYMSPRVYQLGEGFLTFDYNWNDMFNKKETDIKFRHLDNEMNPVGDEVIFPASVTKGIYGIEEIIPLVDDNKVIVEAKLKGGTALLLFDLNNQTIEYFEINVSERLSDFKYTLNKEGDLVCYGIYLVDGGAKNLPDLKGIYLSAFKKGSVESLFSCKIEFKPENFDKYASHSVNMTKTYLRYFKPTDIIIDDNGNYILATERIDDKFNNGGYNKGEIVIYTISPQCQIINEHHIPKMLVSGNARTTVDLLMYKGMAYVIFRDNSLNLDIYNSEEIHRLSDDNKSRGMLVIAKLEPAGRYVKKCLVNQEENNKAEVTYFHDSQNKCEDLLFLKASQQLGKYEINKE